MKAMLLDAPGRPLRAAEVPDPVAGPRRRSSSGSRPARSAGRTSTSSTATCATPKLPLVLGHEIVGVVEAARRGGGALRAGRPGRRAVARLDLRPVPLLRRREARTSATRPGSPATTSTAASRRGRSPTSGSAFRIPDAFGDVEAAPLLCAGLIGYRTLRMAGDPASVGIWGFGAAAHLVAQVARFEGREVFAFTRPGDAASQEFARSLGAAWAGGSDELPPEPLDAALVFAPVGALVPAALRSVRKGGVVVCGGIHMSDIPSFPYELLWGERVLRSVANLTRKDGEEFLSLAARAGVKSRVRPYPLGRGERGARGPAGGAARRGRGPRPVSGYVAGPGRRRARQEAQNSGFLRSTLSGQRERCIAQSFTTQWTSPAAWPSSWATSTRRRCSRTVLGERVLLGRLQAGEGEDAPAAREVREAEDVGQGRDEEVGADEEEVQPARLGRGDESRGR